MLRAPQHHPGHKHCGRGCCAISERSRRPGFASSSLLRVLSPIIPLHRRHSPVSPIIPVHTQNIGGGGVADPAKTMILSTDLLRLSSTGDFNRLDALLTALNFQLLTLDRFSPLTPPIPAPLATAALRVVPTPIFTTTPSIHCRRADNFGAGPMGPCLRGQSQSRLFPVECLPEDFLIWQPHGIKGEANASCST